MADVIRLFADPQLQNVAYEVVPGTATFSGTYADLSNWNERGNGLFPDKNIPMYTCTARTGATISLSGGATLFDYNIKTARPTLEQAFISDKQADDSTTIWWNSFFIGVGDYGTEENPQPRGICLTFQDTSSGESDDPDDDDFDNLSAQIVCSTYSQTPWDADRASRQEWAYATRSTGSNLFGNIDPDFPHSSQFACISVYTTTLGGDEFYVIAAGVGANGGLTPSPSHNSYFLAIPCVYFKDSKPVKGTGKNPRDEANKAFLIGSPSNGKGSGRENYDANPYGIKGGVASDLVGLTQASFNQLLGAIYGRYWIETEEPDPEDPEQTITVETETTISDDTLMNLVNKMSESISGGSVTWGKAQSAYQNNQSLGSDLLKLGVLGSSIGDAIVSGAGTRNAEIVQQILDGILVCHLIPKVSGLVSGGATINRIAGVKIPSISALGLTSEIIELTFAVNAVERRTGCYLDFEPFTTCTLHLPFVGEVNIDPSLAYHGISGKYLIDVYTGGVSVEIYAPNTYVSANPNTPTIVVKQGSCAVDMPIVGTGRNTKGQDKMIATLSSMATGGPMGAIAGLGTLLSHGQEMTMPSLVTKQSNPGVNCYLSPRSIYITMTIPKPANDELFVDYKGYKWNGSGTLSKPGYYEVDEIRLNINAPQAIKEQIISRLREGVIVV